MLPRNVQLRDKRSFPKMPKLDTDIVLDFKDDEKEFVGQKDCVEAMFNPANNQQGIIHRQPGCIASGTMVEINRAGKSFKMPIEAVVEKFNGGGKWAWDLSIPTLIRARYEDGTIRLFELSAALDSGIKTCYRVTTDTGRTIDATLDHPFLTPNGWFKLGELNLNDEVFVDGGQTHNGRQNKPYYYEVTQLWGHPYARSRGRVPFHRLMIEADWNGMEVEDYIEYLRSDKAAISHLKFLTPTQVVHHDDGNTDNNARSNLIVVDSQAKHNSLHETYKHGYAQTITERIVSIKKIGSHHTYDLSLDNEPHNFLANGFVVHNTGKTNIALYFIAKAGTRSLVVVHTEDILNQWIEYAEARIPGIDIGIIRQDREEVGHLTLATVQTLHKRGYPTEFWRLFGATILDECHHAPARTFDTTIAHATSRYRFGLSASHTRADHMEPLVEYMFGKIIHDLPFASPVPVTVIKAKSDFQGQIKGSMSGPMWLKRKKWQGMISRLVNDPERNQLIAKNVNKQLAEGRSVLVLSRRVDHLQNLSELIPDAVILAAKLKSKKERRELLDEFRAGKIKCVLATQLADEALDVPVLSCVALTFPSKHSDHILQQVGRALREHAGKESAVIIDIVDPYVKTLWRQWSGRRRAYMEWGFKITGEGIKGKLEGYAIRKKRKVQVVTHRAQQRLF